MIRISIGTRNQNKIARVKSVVEALLSDEVIANGHDVESGVLDAPLDEQTYIGAKNRAESCNKLDEADYYIGLESGLVERYDQWFEEAWAVVITKEGRELSGYSSGLMLPKIVVQKMQEGQEHGEIMKYFDELFKRPDDRDTWARYTGGGISRNVSFEEALRNVFIQIHDSKTNLYVLNAESNND